MAQAEFEPEKHLDEEVFEELKLSWKKLRFFENALSYSSDHIFIFDKDTRFIYINPAGAKTIGKKPEEIIGKKWTEITLPSQITEPFDIRLRSVYIAKKPIRGEIEYTVDSLTENYEYELNPIIKKDEVESVIVVSRNITERKRAEETLNENDFYNSSLLRLYKSLGKATTYTQIIKALRPEIQKTIGYNSAYLQLILGENQKEWFMLDAGGTAEKKAKDLMGMDSEKYKVKIGGDNFLVLPVEGDSFLTAVSKSKDVLIVKDARDDPLINTEEQKKIITLVENRTIVTVPLALAEKTLGYFVSGTFGDEEGVLVPNERQIDYLRALSNHVAVALDRVRFVTERKEREKELQEDNFFNSSLIRLYKSLGRASTYREILDALRPEIKKTIDYNSVGLLIMKGEKDNFFLLDAQGPVEDAVKNIMQLGDEFLEDIGGEKFLKLPIKGDDFLEELAETDHIDVMEDARTDPRGNKVIVEAAKERTIINVPLMLAEEKLGLLNLGTFGDEGIKIPNERQLEYLDTISNHIAVALDRVRFVTEGKEEKKKLQEELDDCRKAS